MDLDIPAMEEKWKKYWSENRIGSFDRSVLERNRCFSIDTPPPTISGKMHMGHAFSYPHQDFIARYKRMRGYNVYYPWGFDDNGLPTERFTEKALGIKAEKTDLAEFIRLCMQESAKAEEDLKKNWMNLGFSADFSNSYRTFSDESMRVSQSMFLDMISKGRAYREEGPTIRCPTCRTAISQIDLKDITQNSEFVYIKFRGPDIDVMIATTRPELIGACVAVAVNPQDERYSGIIGKVLETPFYHNKVKVIADEMVSSEKGTGAEMVCTFGDQNDIYLWRKYNLETRIILDDFGKFRESAGPISGLTVREGRKRIIELLEAEGVVDHIERIRHSVNAHERCDTPVEFGISKQWYVKVLDIRDDLKRYAHSVDWIPQHMRVRIDNWIDGLKWDWGISRQRFLGVPFPVWYCDTCGATVYAEPKMLPVDPRTANVSMKCPKCGSDSLEPERDVMDTWATSSLSPRLAMIHDGIFPKLYPMDVRFQGHDIISTWAFTTIVRSYIHDGSVPWKEIMISGNVYDPQGQKMSKSRGNIIEPGSLVAEYGADSVRYWASTALPGEDIRVREQDFVRGRRTVIKIYNAAKLVTML
ncbi:MAG: valine--tRNA ligase, partial [Candidatus Thermoplasmatota archaeon]|nr:valine--tRNA ligase [Candidatus Thermoplasmatota archaeon]